MFLIHGNRTGITWLPSSDDLSDWAVEYSRLALRHVREGAAAGGKWSHGRDKIADKERKKWPVSIADFQMNQEESK